MNIELVRVLIAQLREQKLLKTQKAEEADSHFPVRLGYKCERNFASRPFF